VRRIRKNREKAILVFNFPNPTGEPGGFCRSSQFCLQAHLLSYMCEQTERESLPLFGRDLARLFGVSLKNKFHSSEAKNYSQGWSRSLKMNWHRYFVCGFWLNTTKGCVAYAKNKLSSFLQQFENNDKFVSLARKNAYAGKCPQREGKQGKEQDDLTQNVNRDLRQQTAITCERPKSSSVQLKHTTYAGSFQGQRFFTQHRSSAEPSVDGYGGDMSHAYFGDGFWRQRRAGGFTSQDHPLSAYSGGDHLAKKDKIMSYNFHSGGISLPEVSRGNRKTQNGSTKHFTGAVVVGDGAGVRVGTESHLEAVAVLLLSARHSTLDLIEQVAFRWYDEQGKYHVHFIDVVETRGDGTVTGHAVRPWARVSAKYLQKLARIKEQAVEQGFLDDFRLFTEKDVCPVELHNAKLIHSVRRPDCFADPVTQDIVRSSCGVVTVGALVEQTKLAGMGFRAVVRLIRSGHLQMVRHERIEMSSEVFKAHPI